MVIKNAPVFLLVFRVIENFFYKACFVPGLLHLPHLDLFLLALVLQKSINLCCPNIGMWGVYLEKKSLMALSQRAHNFLDFYKGEGPEEGVKVGQMGKSRIKTCFIKKFFITPRTNKNTRAFFVSTLVSLLKRANVHH